MSFQEAYSYLDINYYNTVLFIIIFLQEQVKDFVSTVVCFFMSVFGALCIKHLQAIGCTFYEATMFYEAIVMFSCILFWIIKSRIGFIVFIVSIISFFINFIGYLTPNGQFYTWYYSCYGYLNIIMFEILVWVCIINSRLKPYINRFISYIDDIINNYIEQRKLQWKQ